MSAINETLIRDVVAEVLGRLGQGRAGNGSPAPPTPACGCEAKPIRATAMPRSQRHGVFQDANEACAAAHAAFLQLKKKGVAARARVVEIVKSLAEVNAEEWGRIELEETKSAGSIIKLRS
jgi:aldehyde dehydrogenase